jgi:DNA-binding response OmpR family regulator
VKTKVLLIDDEQTILNLLKVFLEIEGFEVKRLDGASIDALIELCRMDRPDIILMDVNLKSVSGFTLLRVLRQSAEFGDIRVVMTSGMDHTVKCGQEGANAFLMKPYMPDDLVKLIKKLIA